MGMNFLDDSYGYVYLSNGHLKVTADGGNFWTTSDTIALDKGFNPQNCWSEQNKIFKKYWDYQPFKNLL